MLYCHLPRKITAFRYYLRISSILIVHLWITIISPHLKKTLGDWSLIKIELSISKANFITWFKNTSILSLENGKVIIGVPNGFAKEWLENKYNHYLLRAFHATQREVSEIHCQITPDKPIAQTPPRESMRSLDAIQRPSLDGFLRKKLVPGHRHPATNRIFTGKTTQQQSQCEILV